MAKIKVKNLTVKSTSVSENTIVEFNELCETQQFKTLYNHEVLAELMRVYKDANKQSDKTILRDRTPENNQSGLASERATIAISNLLIHNDNANEFDRVKITPTLIENNAGINRKAIKDTFKDFEQRIAKQEKSWGLSTKELNKINLRFRKKEDYPRTDKNRIIYLIDIFGLD